MTLDAIRDFLALGDNLLTSGQPTEVQLAEAAAAGVELVINLALPTSDNALPDEAATVHSLGMKYISIPVIWEEPKRTDLERFIKTMEAHRGLKMLVHCALNYRVSCFVALWYVARKVWSSEMAYDFMHQVWDPDEYPVWKNFIEEFLAQVR